MVLVNILGLLLIGLIVWWFWLYKPGEASAGDGAITVIVEDGVYQPARIRLPAGQPATLRFLRRDASPCAGTVVFADLDISEELPVDKVKEISLPPQPPGTYAFTCQMQMYRGELLVEAQS
ncbi:cupredoxin domain-containing protein [Marinobacterium arenosum]|uniref:cupredoxin domain-containing protein n=1 Tax=Marinobacterium arenosum TaxID=2862496 RepID=UPI001C978821|nr:cupredoxin domain-containing protein [Marinobacterium arenosum]MBY4677591.1 cupredoxin domain-containing protein [Marinobacterium arenosum]